MTAFQNQLASFQAGYDMSRQLKAHQKQKAAAAQQNALMSSIGGVLSGSAQASGVPAMTQGIVPASQANTPIQNGLAGGAPQSPQMPPQGQNGLAPQAQGQADNRYSLAANMAFEAGNIELGQALHETHLKTRDEAKKAKTAEGKEKEDGLRRMKDLLLVAKDRPEMFEQVKQFAAQMGVQGVENATPDQIDGTIAMVNAYLSDPDNNVVLKDGETIFNQATGQVVHSNRAHKVEAHGDNLQAFNPTTGQFGATQTRGQTFEEQETARSNKAGESIDRFANQTDRVEAEADAVGGAGEFGLSPVYGRDADGNRILIQTNKAGGVRTAELPEGVTLEDDAFKTTQRETAKQVVKNKGVQSKIENSIGTAKQKMDLMLEDIDKAIEQSSKSNTGVIGRMNPLQGSQDFKATLKSLQARIGFDELQEMRNNSPTGGALGQVSEREIDFLQRLKGSIDTIQSEGQLDGNLERIKGEIQASYARVLAAYEKDKAAGLFGGNDDKKAAMYNKYGLE